jgi:hypothetical protein
MSKSTKSTSRKKASETTPEVSALSDRRANIKPKQPPLLFDQTQAILKQLEKSLGFPVITFWTSARGAVCDNDTLALYELLSHVGKINKLGLFIKSDGGNPESALRMVNLLREHVKEVVALVPLNCASAATMYALGADQIQMGPLAHLTAIDSSLTHDLSPLDPRENRKVSVSQDELARIVRLWNINSKKDDTANPYAELFKYVHPLVVGAIDRSSSLSIKICQEILSYHLSDLKEAQRISEHLNSAYPSHGYPITAKEAARIGLKIKRLDADVNEKLLLLNRLYSEMAQKALTDFDETNYHDNEILNIHEAANVQCYWQNDKDWNYVKEERRWQTMNDESSWRKLSMQRGKRVQSVLHIR